MDSEILAQPAVGTISASYNALLERFAASPDLEALVLVHQDAEIVDEQFCATIRQALSDPNVGLVGCVGAIGVRSIAWWEASVTCASFVNRYEEYGGGDLESFSWSWSDAPAYARTGEVETLDGFVLVLSPWVVQNIRFDESIGRFHGYDLDFCLQVRRAGYRVLTADFRAIHHRPLEMLPDPEEWIDAHVKVAEKWDGEMGIGAGTGTWPQRAFRAEAEADAALLQAHLYGLELAARTQQLERELALARGSVSWRATRPLRRLSARRRSAAPT
ncbi:MAG TPA: glycosyltransferase [Solirubrobacteraceae bacterium]|nr:glycosyltransferase [Solirubrobacteraceae bacterium]